MFPDVILVVHQKLVLIWKNLNGGIGLSQRYEELLKQPCNYRNRNEV